MFELTEEQREQYRLASGFGKTTTLGILADLAKHAMAAALKAEHLSTVSKCKLPHHDWLRLADEKLREVKR